MNSPHQSPASIICINYANKEMLCLAVSLACLGDSWSASMTVTYDLGCELGELGINNQNPKMKCFVWLCLWHSWGFSERVHDSHERFGMWNGWARDQQRNPNKGILCLAVFLAFLEDSWSASKNPKKSNALFAVFLGFLGFTPTAAILAMLLISMMDTSVLRCLRTFAFGDPLAVNIRSCPSPLFHQQTPKTL